MDIDKPISLYKRPWSEKRVIKASSAFLASATATLSFQEAILSDPYVVQTTWQYPLHCPFGRP